MSDSYREQVRRAIAEADGFSYEGLEPHDYQRHTDAILALSPAVQPVTLPHYTATLTVQRDDAEGEMIVHGVFTGTAAAVVQTLHVLANAFETEAQR